MPRTVDLEHVALKVGFPSPAGMAAICANQGKASTTRAQGSTDCRTPPTPTEAECADKTPLRGLLRVKPNTCRLCRPWRSERKPPGASTQHHIEFTQEQARQVVADSSRKEDG